MAIDGWPLRTLTALVGALLLAASGPSAFARTVSVKAKESGCVDAPKIVDGATYLYRCSTSSGASAYFNVPESNGPPPAPRRPTAQASAPVTLPSPATQPAVTAPGLPRVDAATQKGRDELRRKVLADELATEEKLLVESRNVYANGAPVASAEEQKDPQRYADRIAKLRQSVQLHERNVDALRRELGLPR
ncbi:MAG TPA: hypothetical protein VNE58_11935 [Casimicrobiaceae bacterium]|nr:hypothetical protein [Casimicrobiaceae bacterium]